MDGIRRVEAVRHAVLVDPEARPRFQQPEDLAVDAELVRRAARRLDRVDRVERLVRSVDVQEVAADELRQMREPRLLYVSAGALELVGVAVDADDPCAGMARDFHQRPAYPAAHVGDQHPRPELEYVRQEVLMASERLLEALPRHPGREVE